MIRRAHVFTDHKTELFVDGLKAAGYEVCGAEIADPKPCDMAVAWNRKSSNIDMIRRYERAGARVVIAENGYIGADDHGNRLIAMALTYHLGRGRWFIGEQARHQRHNFEILPWRTGGEEIVILAQRGIGESETPDWADNLLPVVRIKTARPVRVRYHPGKLHTPLEPDLENAYAVITHSSGAGVKALAYGVPVFYMMQGWIGAPAAKYGLDEIKDPYLGDRASAFHRIGWAQWTPLEISSGEAFKTFDNL